MKYRRTLIGITSSLTVIFGIFLISLNFFQTDTRLSVDESSELYSIVFIGAFNEPYTICSFPPYSDCGLNCSVSEGEFFLRAELELSETIWEQRFVSTNTRRDNGRFFESNVHVGRRCLRRPSGTSFVLRVERIERNLQELQLLLRLMESGK